MTIIKDSLHKLLSIFKGRTLYLSKLIYLYINQSHQHYLQEINKIEHKHSLSIYYYHHKKLILYDSCCIKFKDRNPYYNEELNLKRNDKENRKSIEDFT